MLELPETVFVLPPGYRPMDTRTRWTKFVSRRRVQPVWGAVHSLWWRVKYSKWLDRWVDL